MENNNAVFVDVEQLREEEPDDEIPKLAAENEESSHVILRHQKNDSGNEGTTGFPLNRKTEPHALDSICRYAKKIKSFLGWEKDREESEREGSVESARGSVEEQCGSNSEAADGGSFTYSEPDKSNETETESGDIGENISGISVAQPNNSSCLDAENVPAHVSEVDDIKIITLSSVCENESDCGLEEESVVHENNFDQKIFRSEISITVADCRSELLTSSGNVASESSTSESDILKSTEMDESLVQENNLEAGLALNDADEILRKESFSISGGENKRDGENNSLESTYESNISSDGKETANDDKLADEECKTRNDLNEGKTLEESTTVSPENKTTVTSGEADNVSGPDQNSKEEVKEKKEPDNNNKEPLNRNSEPQKCEYSEQNNVDALKISLPLNDEKNSVEQSKKLTQAKDGVKSYGSLKASVYYEKGEKKQAVPNKATSQEGKSFLYEDDTTCGLAFFKPQWLQTFATPKMYVILYSIIGILHGSYYSYLIGTVSTLEKRFAFKSKISGVIMIADEITPLLLGVIIGYYAGKAHRPRMVAIGMLLSAGCCFSSSLPYFVYGPAQHLTSQSVQNYTGTEYCDAGAGNKSCDLDERPPTVPAVLFLVLGSFLKGFGNLAYYAIGLAYLDDNSDKKSTPIYLAVALALRLLGPLVGFLMSSAFLKIYENPFEDPGFGPDDPRWIGAWWMGFFLQGVLLVIFTLPIALFPRRLPSQKKLENFHPVGKKESMKETLAGLLSALKRLGKNPIFIIMIVNTTMKIFGHFGHSIMLPKYMENQFRLSAADASLFSGATSITCVMLSTVLGGFLIWKFRPRVKLLLAGMVISEIILCIGFLILMIPRCQPADMLHFGMNDEGLILDNVCNQNCDCSTTSFTPFCGPDGKTTYFSPCYAGCTQELKSVMSSGSKRHKEFGNCSCISVTDSTESIPAKITEGFCPDENCWSQTLAYLIILFVLLMISNTLTVAHTMILLRSVHPGDKSVALGTFETFICLFGFIPFPVTFGALVDSACLVWEESCGETGNCWFYDMEKYGYLLHGAAALFCSLSIVCLITLYLLSDRVRNLYAEETEEEDHIDNIKLDTVSGSVTKL